ncbi:MAG: hypothetical protein RIR33_113 [Pseudomonadota bacterium]|jgi:hypothetical protein
MPIPKRFLELVRAGLVASLFAPIAISQTPQQAPAAYVPTETRADPDLPRTSFGHPSLEGVWGSNWVLPLEASSRVPMLVLPEEVAQGYAAAYAKGVGDALDRQLDPEVPETMRNVEGLPLVRGERRARAVVIPANGMLPYTAKARAESERGQPGGGYNNPEERPNWERCVRSLGQPPLYPIGNTPRQIIQRPDKVIIFTEYGGEARIIPFSDTHKPKMFWDLLGDAIAHWEGNTLVIETIGLPEADRVRLFPSFVVSGKATVIERYTRLGMDELLYQFTVIDPDVYTEPWLAEYSIYPIEGGIYEHACHEGNYAMNNILLGGRIADARKAPRPD